VKDDYAEFDLPRVWDIFNKKLDPIIASKCKICNISEEQIGYFEVYGIPAYVPVTFASYTKASGIQYCTLEVGIGVVPELRTLLYFQKVSDEDIYSSLHKIYRGIIAHRLPLKRIPNKT